MVGGPHTIGVRLANPRMASCKRDNSLTFDPASCPSYAQCLVLSQCCREKLIAISPLNSLSSVRERAIHAGHAGSRHPLRVVHFVWPSSMDSPPIAAASRRRRQRERHLALPSNRLRSCHINERLRTPHVVDFGLFHNRPAPPNFKQGNSMTDTRGSSLPGTLPPASNWPRSLIASRRRSRDPPPTTSTSTRVFPVSLSMPSRRSGCSPRSFPLS